MQLSDCCSVIRVGVKLFPKVLSRLKGSRRRNGEYIATSCSLTNVDGAVEGDDCQLSSNDELEVKTMSLPPRYRFRDLLLGDFASFLDDGER